MNSNPKVDQRAVRIAGASSILAGSVAVFWIGQLVRGAVPIDELRVVNILCFGVLAYAFFRCTKSDGTIDVLAMVLFLYIPGEMAKQDSGVAGRLTSALAFLLCVANMALHDRRRRDAEPAVAADGLRAPLNG